MIVVFTTVRGADRRLEVGARRSRRAARPARCTARAGAGPAAASAAGSPQPERAAAARAASGARRAPRSAPGGSGRAQDLGERGGARVEGRVASREADQPASRRSRANRRRSVRVDDSVLECRERRCVAPPGTRRSGTGRRSARSCGAVPDGAGVALLGVGDRAARLLATSSCALSSAIRPACWPESCRARASSDRRSCHLWIGTTTQRSSYPAAPQPCRHERDRVASERVTHPARRPPRLRSKSSTTSA